MRGGETAGCPAGAAGARPLWQFLPGLPGRPLRPAAGRCRLLPSALWGGGGRAAGGPAGLGVSGVGGRCPPAARCVRVTSAEKAGWLRRMRHQQRCQWRRCGLAVVVGWLLWPPCSNWWPGVAWKVYFLAPVAFLMPVGSPCQSAVARTLYRAWPSRQGASHLEERGRNAKMAAPAGRGWVASRRGCSPARGAARWPQPMVRSV